jgi:hypothetical protein
MCRVDTVQNVLWINAFSVLPGRAPLTFTLKGFGATGTNRAHR